MTNDQLSGPEKWFPLRVLVCEQCWLAQTEDFADPEELFAADYAYFSGFSASWVRHCEAYVGDVSQRFGLDTRSHFVEVASNDGTLLDFAYRRGMKATGIEPTHATAEASRAKGHTVVEKFLGVESAGEIREEHGPADLIAANNVLAHVPDINSFVGGVAHLLADDGVATFEFPHVVNLVEQNQFDTIYHEHYSYLSLTAAVRIFAAVGLEVFDVAVLPTHGGSLRVFVQHKATGTQATCDSVQQLLGSEARLGVKDPSYYQAFQQAAEGVKNAALSFLLGAKKDGKSVVGYGAAAKGNTLLNFAGVRPDLLHFVVDLNPAKQGLFLPGSRIPILSVDQLHSSKPDYVVILPWNLRREVVDQLVECRDHGTKFVTFVPELEVTSE